LKNLKERFQHKRNHNLDTDKDKTSITKISCLGQTARNFITVSGGYSNVKNAPDKEEVGKFWREIYGKEVKHYGEAHRNENQYHKIQPWYGAQYVKKTLQRH